MGPRLIRRFNRYELKYVAPWAKCEAIIQDLLHHIPRDAHSGEAGYRSVSLYYDSPDHDFFWAKVEGIKFRRKVRTRLYPDGDLSQAKECMVEIKQRINRTVQKRRLVLPIPVAEALCEGRGHPDGLDELDQQVANEVHYLSLAKHLRPTLVTAYMRRAFEGQQHNAGLRVTFDTDVRARVHALEINAEADNHLVIPPGWAIMEVKANDAVPVWMLALLAKHECQLRRISKYCLGLARLKGLSERVLLMHAVPSFGGMKSG
jgi:hypothetical protein